MNGNDSFDFWNDVLRLKGFQVVHVRRDAPMDPIRLTLIPTTMKNFQDHLTAARREIQKQLPREEAKALNGTRWLWLTNEENLSPEEREELSVLQERFPLLGKLRRQREKLRELFENRSIRTAASGTRKLGEWMQEAQGLGLQALDGFCKTLQNWLDKVANDLVSRSSNGRVGGDNTGLREILRRAFGMLSFKHFRLRALDRFGVPKLC